MAETAMPGGALYKDGICFITDRESSGLSCIEMASIALESGIRWIQYRDKNRNRSEAFRLAMALREITFAYGACLIVNDYSDIAAGVEADGVHLGQTDLPVLEARRVIGQDAIIGVSTHNAQEARQAELDGADYIGFGPVFETTTKDAGQPRGIAALRKVREAVGIPVVAIGGVSHANCHEVFANGASAVAAASSILGGDVSANACFLVDKVSSYCS